MTLISQFFNVKYYFLRSNMKKKGIGQLFNFEICTSKK